MRFNVRAWRTADVHLGGLHVPAGQEIVVRLDPAAPKRRRVDRGTLALLDADPRLEVRRIPDPLEDVATAPVDETSSRQPGPAARTRRRARPG